MRILIIPDKFKGSLTSSEAAQTIQQALEACVPGIQTVVRPVADGGEGTADMLTQATAGKQYTLTVNDPLFRPVKASYGISGDGQTAFIEMAQASGLRHLKPEERNPMLTSTFGTGELIKDAIARGVSRVLLCLGGSATNDGGIGMAAALGYIFFDHNNQLLSPVGGSLRYVTALKRAVLDVPLSKVKFGVACDVDNPLFGPKGAAYTYGAQKGATPDDIVELDRGLRRLSTVLSRDFGIDEADLPGSGAAGGLGFGARVFLKATLEPGFDLVAQTLQLEDEMTRADLVITGEGSLDEQTLNGKVIAGVSAMAQRHAIPAIAFCGQLSLSDGELAKLGLKQAIAISPPTLSLTESLLQAPALLRTAVADWASQTLKTFS